MTVNAIESGVGDVWQVKQAALGTIEPANSTNTKHLRKVGEDALKPAKTYGSEEWLDGKAWGSPGMYVQSIGGEIGDLPFQAQIETTGFAFAQIIGVDTVTGTDPDYTHTIASGTANGPYQTIRQKVGVNVGPWRNSFFDAKVNKLTLNVGQDQRIMRITENLWALKAASWYIADPTATDSGTDPFEWSEAEGAHSIDGTVFPEIDGETLELDRKLEVHQGDSPKPVCFIPGKGLMTSTMSALVTDGTIPVIQKALYGTTVMTEGLEVNADVNTVALESTYTRTAARSLKITRPKVAVDPSDFAVGARAEGGKLPVAFGGRCLDSGATPMLTVVAKTGDSAAYV